MTFSQDGSDICALLSRSKAAISIATSIAEADTVDAHDVDACLNTFGSKLNLDDMLNLAQRSLRDGDHTAGIMTFERLFSTVCPNMSLTIFTTGGLTSDYQIVIRGKPASGKGPSLNGTAQHPSFGRAMAVASWRAVGAYFAGMAEDAKERLT